MNSRIQKGTKWIWHSSLYIEMKTIIINETMLTACQLRRHHRRRRRHLCFIVELFAVVLMIYSICETDTIDAADASAAYFNCNNWRAKKNKNKEKMSKTHWFTQQQHCSVHLTVRYREKEISTLANDLPLLLMLLMLLLLLLSLLRRLNRAESHEKRRSVGTMSQHRNNYWIIVYHCVKRLSCLFLLRAQIKTQIELRESFHRTA